MILLLPSTIPNPNPNFISFLSSQFNFLMLLTMSSSSSSSSCSLFRPTHTPSLLLRRRNAPLLFGSPALCLRSKRHSLRLSASVEERSLHLSWSSSEQNSNDYGGWAFTEPPAQKQQRKGLPAFFLAGVGTSVVVAVAAIAHFSFSSKGLKLQFHSPLQSIQKILNVKESEVKQNSDSGELNGNDVVSKSSPDSAAGAVNYTFTSDKFERVIIPVVVDSTQQKALAVLKKLKIIEDDVNASELCTRREYARWLVRINSLLERNPSHRIVPAISLSGSVICAFDDVSVDDPDFDSIQSLAEAGLIPSKLSWKNSSSNGSNDKESIYFSPERFISRQDMINWKVQLEYEFLPGILEQISRKKVAFMDVKDISSNASPELFMDMLAGDKSILRKVFGQSRRFLPHLPSTKAQAAVALISGRMKEAINTELSRLESESFSRQADMEEIKKELLSTGVIQRFWHEKLEEEKARGIELEKVYLAALQEFEEEKVVQENILADHLKEKSAMDCQRQLLASLKEEVDEMSERLSRETTMYIAEQKYLQGMLSEMEMKLEELLDAKSLLGSEKEAIRILRSWVEEEARKSQARGKVLEEVGQRWKWDDKPEHQHPTS